MSAETVVTAIFLITAVIAVGVLANAIMPVISTMGGTFSSSANAADEKMRTDFKIVATLENYTTSNPDYKYYDYDIFMKNIGSQRISLQEVTQSDVFCGVVDTNIARITYIPDSDPPTSGTPSGVWTAEIRPADNPNPGFWDPGETLAVYAKPHTQYEIDTSENLNSFQFILPNGVWRSTEFVIT
jgi:flagellar protein FlaG